MSASWYQRFLSSTRGRLVTLLRRDTRTVDELASALSLTDNAVRAHLATLERDGLVRQHGVRRGAGSGKPAYAYELTPEAEQLFPKPYAAVLETLLAGLDERMSPDQFEALLRESGRRLAEQRPAAKGDTHSRLETAVAALNQWGGLAELEELDNKLVIQSHSCPLAALVPDYPAVCHLAEAFVSKVASLPIRESCERDPTPRCRFELAEQP